jgi:hypothetical protein
MKSKLSILGLVLILSALILSGCRSSEAQRPTVEVPDEVRAARDATLAHVSEHYGEQAPAPDLIWIEKNVTPGWPESPVPDWVEYRYTSEDWVITIGYVVRPPEWIVYRVVVTNQTTGFQWKGEVDAAGQATEQPTPEEVRAARDAARAYVVEHYGKQAPASGLTWREMDLTREGQGWTGSVKCDFTSEGWAVTVYCPVLPPEVRVCTVVVNQTTGFQWQGEVDAAGQVTEKVTATDG